MPMSHRTESGSDESGWSDLEIELLARAKQVARRIVERVRAVTEDTATARKLGPDDPTDEVPVVG
jgi:hypothetical protein